MALRFFDAHVSVGPRRIQGWTEVAQLDAVLDRLGECGVAEALVYHTASVESHPAEGNRRVLETVRGNTAVHPVWAMLPFSTKELGGSEELRLAMKSAGVKAVLLYPAEHNYSCAEWCCGDLYDLLEAMRMPVFTRFSPSDLGWNDLARILSDHPALPLILRNVGYQIDRSAYRILERFDGFRIETARYLVYNGIEEIVRLFGSRRLVFGSEAPILSPGAAVTPILTAAIPPADKERIAGLNLRELVEGIRYDA